MGLIYQRCKVFTSLNPVAFTRDRAGDVQVNWSAAEAVVNIKVTEDLICFIYVDEITFRSNWSLLSENILDCFFWQPGLQSTPETNMAILFKSV